MQKLQYLINVGLVSAIALLPITAQPQPAQTFAFRSRAQLDAFRQRCVQNVANNDTAALLADFRKTYRVPADNEISVSLSSDPPIIAPEVALGCIILVVVVAVVVWGIVIYVIYRICTKPDNGGGTNS